VLICVLLLTAARAGADPTVPLDLQVDLLRKVVRFERGFAGRGGAQVTLLLVGRPHNSDGERAAAQIAGAMARAREIAGRPVKVTTHDYSSPAALRRAVSDSGAQLVYLLPGLAGDIAAIAAALDGLPAITVSTDGEEVERGAVLGFELASAHPKIVLNLGQARKQRLDFDSDLFRLARVVR
jgi:hypothetical protein